MNKEQLLSASQIAGCELINDAAGLQVFEQATKITIPANTTLFRQGDHCENYLLVLSGSIKVYSRAENGREILLYRVKQGESCTLTTSCLLARNKYPAEGITETETSALIISASVFNQGLQSSSDFRQFVFNAYGQRISDIIVLVEEISFGRIDIRLAKNLLNGGNGNRAIIQCTHQSLATELGSAREVISRQLKSFENRGWVILHRGSIEITNHQALAELAQRPLM